MEHWSGTCDRIDTSVCHTTRGYRTTWCYSTSKTRDQDNNEIVTARRDGTDTLQSVAEQLDEAAQPQRRALEIATLECLDLSELPRALPRDGAPDVEALVEHIDLFGVQVPSDSFVKDRLELARRARIDIQHKIERRAATRTPTLGRRRARRRRYESGECRDDGSRECETRACGEDGQIGDWTRGENRKVRHDTRKGERA